MSIISETGVIMVTYTGLSGLYTGIMKIKFRVYCLGQAPYIY